LPGSHLRHRGFVQILIRGFAKQLQCEKYRMPLYGNASRRPTFTVRAPNRRQKEGREPREKARGPAEAKRPRNAGGVLEVSRGRSPRWPCEWALSRRRQMTILRRCIAPPIGPRNNGCAIFPKKKSANLCWRSHSLPPHEVAPGFISGNRVRQDKSKQ